MQDNGFVGWIGDHAAPEESCNHDQDSPPRGPSPTLRQDPGRDTARIPIPKSNTQAPVPRCDASILEQPRLRKPHFANFGQVVRDTSKLRVIASTCGVPENWVNRCRRGQVADDHLVGCRSEFRQATGGKGPGHARARAFWREPGCHAGKIATVDSALRPPKSSYLPMATDVQELGLIRIDPDLPFKDSN